MKNTMNIYTVGTFLAFASSVFGVKKFSVPSSRTIIPLAKKMSNVSAISAVDSVTKGQSVVRANSEAFAQGSELSIRNASAVQGASAMQMGANAGGTSINSIGITGGNLLTIAKTISGSNGGLTTQMQSGAIASSNTSTQGKALTKITGNSGSFGNSSIDQSGTVIGATVSVGQVTGSNSGFNIKS